MNGCYFPNDVYNTFLGSFALCQALLNDKFKTEKDLQHFKTLFFRARKKKWNMKDSKILEKIAKFFECEMKLDSIALVVSPYNMLFTFYTMDEDKVVVLPLMENGYLPITLKTGKIYTLKEGTSVLDQFIK